ncbi:MAG: hypothetical protein HXS48_23215 [Theionarchaea archaeon]|nr:hypothetical protein [Theionarchaea archaeon]
MQAPKWFIVARNEYRIRTSSIRVIRPYLPYLVIVALAIYVIYIAPTIVDLFIDDPVEFLLSRVAVALVEILLFMLFCYFIIIPIASTLKDVQTSQLQIFLSAPIKSSDVLLGEFLGALPLYAIIITVITGFFTALMNPLGLDMIQITVTVLIFIVTLSSADWIGTVIAALLRTRLGKIARGRDIGKALALIIALPLVAFIWTMTGGGLLETLSDPGTSGMVKTILGWLPSSWGADVIISFASNPGDIAAVGSTVVTRFGGLLLFFVAALWVGTKLADRAYSMEITTFTAPKVEPDGIFYKTTKHLGGSFGTLFVSVFKVYIRRLQNLSYIAYIVGLLAMANIFLYTPEEPVWVLEQGVLFFPILATFVSSDITLRGKETLFIYRKTPDGESQFVKAMLLKGWLVAIPIAGTITAVATLLVPHVTLISVLSNAGFIMVVVAADVLFASGLFLLMPAYTEKGEAFMLNVMVVMIVSVGFFMVCLPILREVMVLPILHWLMGVIFLYGGKRNLSRIE